MKHRARLYGIYLPIFLILLPLVVALRSVALMTELDPYGYFNDPLLINIANALVVAGVIFFLTYIWVARKELKLIPSFESSANYVPCAIVSAALLLLAVHLFHNLFSINLSAYLLPARVLHIATPVFALVSIVYFIMSAISVKRRSIKRSGYGIVTLLFLCMYVANIYFDTSLPINSPNKIVDQMAFLAVTMFFLYELRLSLGRERWRHYISFGFIAALLTAYSAIPSLIVYFAEGKTISLSIYESILTLAFFVFALLKLLLAGSLTTDETSPVVQKIIDASRARAEELEPAAPVKDDETAAEDENQISIDEMELENSEITEQKIDIITTPLENEEEKGADTE